MAAVQKAITILAAAALAVALLVVACRADKPSYDDASAEEILAAAKEAMGEVGSFACVTESTFGDPGEGHTIKVEDEFQDLQNYRRVRSLYSGARLFDGPSEVAVVDGKTFSNRADSWSDTPPVYALPSDVSGLERLDDTTLDGARVYHLHGTQPPNPNTSAWTVDLFINAATILMVGSESRTTLRIESQGDVGSENDSSEPRTAKVLSTTTCGRFGEDFNIVPPAPTPTPTPRPTATPTPTPR